MALLTKDQILKADDLPTTDVECPEWGGSVRLRSLTGAERDAFEASTVIQAGTSQRINMVNLRARLVSLCAVGEDGKRLFTEADLKGLGGKSALVLDRLFDAARNLSGMSNRDVEALAEGLGGAPNGSSTSA